jgi:hypothetical protein
VRYGVRPAFMPLLFPPSCFQGSFVAEVQTMWKFGFGALGFGHCDDECIIP